MWRMEGPHHGPGHAQRAEYVLLHEHVVVLPRSALDDDRGESVCRVVVVPLRAGDILECRLPLHDLNDLRAVDPVAPVEAASGHAEQVQELAQARGVGDEVPHLDGLVELGQLGDVGADVVVKRQEAALRLQHDREGGELLRGGADVGACIGLEGDPVGQVGHSVGLRVQGLAVSPHADRGARRMLAVESRHHLVGELLGVGGDVFVPQKRDLVAARGVFIVPQVEQLGRVGAGRLDPAAEAFMAAAESAESGDLRAVGVQDPDRDVDGDLVDFAEDELVCVRLDGVTGRVAGSEGAGEGAAALQLGGLGGEVAGGEGQRECGEEGGWAEGETIHMADFRTGGRSTPWK